MPGPLVAPRPPPIGVAAAAAAAAAQRRRDAHGVLPAAIHVDSRFAWQPGQGMQELDDDRPTASFADNSSRNATSLRSAASSRVSRQIERLKEAEADISQLMIELNLLRVQPQHRLDEESARSLNAKVTSVLQRFDDITDDDIWRTAVRWPANKSSRLDLALKVLDVVRCSAAAVASAARKLDDPSSAGTPAAADLDSFWPHARRAISDVLFTYEKVDGPCCYVSEHTDALSTGMFTDCLRTLREAVPAVWSALGTVLEKVKSGGGSAFDKRAYVERASSLARQLVRMHEDVRWAQHGRVRWAARRSGYTGADFLALANDPSCWGGVDGRGLEIALTTRAVCTDEEREQWGEQGALGPGAELPDGGILGAEQLQAVQAISACATADKLVNAYDSLTSMQQAARLWTDIGRAGEQNGSTRIKEQENSPVLTEEDAAVLRQALQKLRSNGADSVAADVCSGAIPLTCLHATVGAGMSLVRQAIVSGHMQVMKACLLAGYDPRFVHPDGSTAFHLCAAKGGDVGLNGLAIALHTLGRVCLAEDAPAAMHLVSTTLDKRNNAGATALQLAARNSVSNMTQAVVACVQLITAGADPTNSANAAGTEQSPLLYLYRRLGGDAAVASCVNNSLPASSTSSLSSLGRCLGSSAFSDVTLLTLGPGGEDMQIPAHRVVLAASSAVWRTMFEGSWSESKETSHRVTPDINHTILRLVLEWAYTGAVSLPAGNAEIGLQLYVASCSLDIPSLCAWASSYLATCLSPLTACAIWDTCHALGVEAKGLARAAGAYLLQQSATVRDAQDPRHDLVTSILSPTDPAHSCAAPEGTALPFQAAWLNAVLSSEVSAAAVPIQVDAALRPRLFDILDVLSAPT